MLRKRKCDRHREKGERCERDGVDEEGRAKRQTDKRVDADRMRHTERWERETRWTKRGKTDRQMCRCRQNETQTEALKMRKRAAGKRVAGR